MQQVRASVSTDAYGVPGPAVMPHALRLADNSYDAAVNGVPVHMRAPALVFDAPNFRSAAKILAEGRFSPNEAHALARRKSHLSGTASFLIPEIKFA